MSGVGSPRRLTVFRVLALVAGILFLLANIPVAISPWGQLTLPGGTQDILDPAAHRWSAALAGGPDIGAAALLFYVAWRPSTAELIMQWLGLAVIVFLATQVPFIGPAAVIIVVPFLLVLRAYPRPRELLKAPWRDGVDRRLLALGLVTTILLVPGAAAALLAQIRAADALAAHYNWASNGEHLINLKLAALLAGMRRPGALVLAAMVGAVLVYLGVAALAVPTSPGSFGMVGGGGAIAMGIAFLAIVGLEWRRGADRRSAR